MQTRNVPHNLEAEQSVLGAMVLSKFALQKAADALTKESFYSVNNSIIFDCLTEMAEKKIPIDLTTLTSELKNKNKLDEIGGVEYLTEIIDYVPTSANVDQYIKLVEEAALLRRLIDVSTDIVSSAYASDINVNDTLDNAERKILSVVKNRRSTEFKPIKSVLEAAEANLEKLAETKGDVTGVATGWYDIDNLTSGLHENEFIIIAARPAMGKTAFALNLATNVAMNNKKRCSVIQYGNGC